MDRENRHPGAAATVKRERKREGRRVEMDEV